MPIYEYECQECHSQFEVRHGFEEEPEVSCPRCRGPARRVLRPVPIIFKGSGFYVTDSRREKGVKEEGEEKETAAAKEK